MTTAGRRRGRRDNGLDASDWRAIDDLDPRVSEAVLDALAARGIAAYVQPAMDVDPVTRSTTLPSRPRDRLYVDRSRTEAAQDFVRQLQASGGKPDSDAALDSRFAEIVAGFDQPADPTAARWPEAEGVTRSAPEPEPEPEPEQAPAPQNLTDGRHLTEPSLLDALDALDRAPPVPDEDLPEQYDPPPPPPLPRVPSQAALGTLTVLIGLVLVIGQPDFLPLDRSATMLLGFAAMLGGAAALIALLRPGSEPEEETRPDDGAQV